MGNKDKKAGFCMMLLPAYNDVKNFAGLARLLAGLAD